MRVIANGRGLVVGFEKINLNDFPNLEVLGCNVTSLEHLSWDEINHRGIKVISLRDYPEFLKKITSTAEHTIGLIIALLRNYKIALNPPYQDREKYKGHTLQNKRLGLIGGKGRVGKQVERMALGLGMDISTYDKTKSFWTRDINWTLDEVLLLSDIISIHIPLDGNEGFFDREMFLKMKSTAYLVNTSRSGVIEAEDLIWALENTIIKGAAIDFTDDPALVEYAKIHNNLILTPHLGGCTHEDMQATENFIIKKTQAYLDVF